MNFESCANFNFKNWVLTQNDIWVLALWPGTKNTIMWKVVAFSESRSSWILWIYVCPWFVHDSSMHQKCSNYTLTNLLIGLCRSVWIIDLLVTLPNPHPEAQACPSTPKVLQIKEPGQIFYPFVIFTLWIHSWIHQRVWGCVIALVNGHCMGICVSTRLLSWCVSTLLWTISLTIITHGMKLVVMGSKQCL